MTRRLILIAAACVIPGGFVIGAGVIVYRWHRRRYTRRQIEAEVKARTVGWGKQVWGEA
jgi:hypothetical protein